jgi:hypothetical protein
MSRIAALRQLLEQRYPDTAPLIQQVAPVLSTGIAVLDNILPGSGLPRGKLTAWQAEAGTGAILRHACRAVVAGGERAAWIGSAGILTLDPAETSGMLLVRPATPRHALRSTEVLLRSGGLALLVLTHVDPDRTASVRLTHAAREGGTALVVVARTTALASLRLSSRFLPDRMQWARDPFGEPALPRIATLEVRVETLGWTRRVTISLPLTPYEFRLSPDPAWADRRGTPSRPDLSSDR